MKINGEAMMVGGEGEEKLEKDIWNEIMDLARGPFVS
jgi:hypothetical protein